MTNLESPFGEVLIVVPGVVCLGVGRQGRYKRSISRGDIPPHECGAQDVELVIDVDVGDTHVALLDVGADGIGVGRKAPRY